MSGLSRRTDAEGGLFISLGLIVRSLSFTGKAMFNRMAGLFLAQPCPICHRATPQTFCFDCDRQLQHAYRTTPSSQKSAQSLPVVALGRYGGALKQAILAMKYQDRPDVAVPLGVALAKRWQRASAFNNRQALYALPIPLHAERQKLRGYNQAERIAASFCKVSDLLHVPHGLQRIKTTQPQHALSAEERKQNLAQVFQVSESLRQATDKNKRASAASNSAILLIDDIYTTGATAQSAATTLKQAGFPVIGIAVLAQAELG